MPATSRSASGRKTRWHESEAQYRALVEQAADGIFVTDAQGRYLDVNPSGCAMLGYTREEILDKDYTLILLPEELAQDPPKLDLLRDGKILLRERVYKRKDGTIFNVEINAKMLSDGRIQSIVRDVTERKRTEEALASSEAELRALFASMRDVVLVIDREGVYREIAPTIPPVWQVRPNELLGKRLQDVFSAEQSEVFHEIIQQVLDTKQTAGIEYELTIGNPSVWYEASVSPMGADRTLWVARDITERKRAAEELRKLSQKDEKALRIAHMGRWEFDVATAQFSFNDLYYSLHGTTAEEAGGYLMSAEQFASRYVHPDNSPVGER